MPWSNQSGGGSGGGGQGPWGSGGGGGGGGGTPPPDLEEILRKGQERLKSLIPGGGGSALGVGLVIVVVAAVWLATGLYRVQPDEQGVVLIFGKAINLTGPGLHYNFPAPIGDVIKPKVTRQNRVDIGYRGAAELNERGSGARDVLEESLILTGDENIVDMDFTVLWRIRNAQEYLFNLRDPELTVKAAAESAMREVVGQETFDRAVTVGRREIEDRTRDHLQEIMDSYKAGILIENVNLQKSDPPSEVIDAFNDVQRARQDRVRLQNEADAYANSVVPEARGLAQKDINEAEAYREQQIQEARGEADRFTSVYNAYKVAPDVTRKRMYLETLGAVLGSARKVIIDQKGGGSGVVPYLPLPEVERGRRNNAPNSGQ
ncbi:MAG: FtsH protease activity modulator HflK [Rhodospirillaceae bacterium]|jgi:modulator of FtsH protease HflK|nr:FtsH protease activity modulator HflK [Rhodospirillaceae bacterium]MBT5666156.1 FtsH protease activity modulator HflK [Rhodospirillaceae bacterium]MBT5811281.1 FtsH protease activity modulator HflK [Rhodospirillaceae bacterium]